MADKKGDLAGPGIGDYNELEKVLPTVRVIVADADSARIAGLLEN